LTYFSPATLESVYGFGRYRYHYLGYKRPIGTHLRYFIFDKDHRRLGCLRF